MTPVGQLRDALEAGLRAGSHGPKLASVLGLDTIKRKLQRRPPARLPDTEGWRRAAVAAVFRDGGSGAELLFMQRAHHPRDPWSGQLSFPGGRAEPHDRSLLHTAARETQEEVGLQLLEHAEVVGPLDELQARARRKVMPLAIHPHAFVWGDAEVHWQLDEAEVADAFWVPLETLADPARRQWFDAHRSDVPYAFPAIDVGRDVPLWGLTHRMVVGILERLELVEDADSLSLPRPLAS